MHCIDYHPKDHIIAMSHYGHFTPVLIFEHDVHYEDNVVVKDLKIEKMDDMKNVESPKIVPEPWKRAVMLEKESAKPTLEKIIEKMDIMIKNKVIY